jgi:cysteine desulfurase / selenocysteine lyase
MSLVRDGDFGGFDGRAWLNCAHQGPLPAVAVAAAERALADKAAPRRMDDEAFTEVPRRLKEALGRLVGVPADQVILGNSTTYGLQLLVQGIDWREGDEVLLVDGDFPATIVPWLPLAERGVRVRLLRPEGGVPEAGQLEAELTPATRLFCTSWVFSFAGRAVDLAALGRVCRRAGVVFAVNGSQGVGAAPLDLAAVAADALVSCGFKWLCGPYGTGFCWLRPELLASLTYRPAYWLGHTAQEDLGQETAYRLRDDLGAAAYDVFGTANFLVFRPWTASVEYLLELGLDRVAAWDQALVERFLAGLDPDRYRLVSPRAGPGRSTLVVLGHRQPDRTPGLCQRLAAAGIDVAFRRGQLRVSPHLYNTEADIDRALEVLGGRLAPAGPG